MVRAALPPDWRCARCSQSSHDGRVNASCSRNPTGCSGLSEGRLTHPPRPPAQCQGPHVAFRSGSSRQPHGHRWAWHAHPRVLADGGGGQHSRSSAQRPPALLRRGRGSSDPLEAGTTLPRSCVCAARVLHRVHGTSVRVTYEPSVVLALTFFNTIGKTDFPYNTLCCCCCCCCLIVSDTVYLACGDVSGAAGANVRMT